MYKCPRCEQTLPKELFGKGKRREAYCRDCMCAYRKERRLLNIEEAREKDRKRWLNPARRAWMKQRRVKEENRKQAAARAKEWRENNKARYLEALARWRASSAIKIRRYARERIVAEAQRCPSWLTEEDRVVMQCFYAVAQMYSRHGSKEWQVDHIVPLRGKLVSGLHVPWNLQLLTKEENHRKLNRFEVL